MLLENQSHSAPARVTSHAAACGKLILAGEHAVVYGRHALALPIPLAIEVRVTKRRGPQRISIPAWGIDAATPVDAVAGPVQQCCDVVCRQLGLQNEGFDLDVDAHIPRGSGLGGSAALAVASTRALAHAFGMALSHADVNRIGFAAEQVAHGRPSGVDNTVATYEHALLFRKQPHLLQPVTTPEPLPLVIGVTGKAGMTLNMVAKVAALRRRFPIHVEGLLGAIDALALGACDAVQAGDLATLGDLMNMNHGLLCALGVSSPELDSLVHLARSHGAIGAKLTGGGGGGAMVALCPGTTGQVADAIGRHGCMAHVVAAC